MYVYICTYNEMVLFAQGNVYKTKRDHYSHGWAIHTLIIFFSHNCVTLRRGLYFDHCILLNSKLTKKDSTKNIIA